MSISIITPTYNGSAYLRQTLESVRAQTLTTWEHILVDDGSTDDTPHIVAGYAERDPRFCLVCQQNGGVARARNRGLESLEAASRYVLFLDHDDLLEPDALETLAEALKAHPQAVAAYGLARFVDNMGVDCRPGEAEAFSRARMGIENGRIVPWPLDRPTTFGVTVLFNYIHTPGQALIRREALDKTGPLDPETVPSDDHDLWIRLTAYGDMPFLNRVVLGFRQHGSNQSGNIARMHESAVRLRRKLLAAPPQDEDRQRVVAQAKRLWHLHLAMRRMEWARQSLGERQPRAAAQQMRHAALSYLTYLRGGGA